jgi:uncharacterized protein (TIGR02266 family)
MLRLVINMEGDNNFYTGLSEDISEGGVFIATQHLLPIGTPVVLSFTLMRSLQQIVLHGTVRWQRGVEATANGHSVFGGNVGTVKSGIGVQFDEVPPDVALTIRNFMRRRVPEFFD